VEGKAARERRWPPLSYVGSRSVRVLTPHDPTTIRLWESFRTDHMAEKGSEQN